MGNEDFNGTAMYVAMYVDTRKGYVALATHGRVALIGGLQPISRDTDNNAEMYNCWWTNKRS